MTNNKHQGQTLKPGIVLQFNVECSTVSSPRNLVVLMPRGKTTNVFHRLNFFSTLQ